MLGPELLKSVDHTEITNAQTSINHNLILNPAVEAMKKKHCFLCLCLSLAFGATGSAQDDSKNDKADESKVATATIKGRLVQNENQQFRVDLSELKPVLNQQIQLPQPPIPETWAEMTIEQRQTWVKEFEASEKGKAFLADRKKRIEAAARFPIQLEDDGNFTVYDVPHGSYGIRGFLEKEIAGKKYVMEVFGQISIAEKVDEVLLDPMMVAVTRRLSKGEATPDFEILQFDGQRKINRRLLESSDAKQKYVLLNFWSMQSPPSQEFCSVVQKAYAAVGKKHQIQLLSICVDSDPAKTLAYVKEKKLLGWQGYVENWEHEMINEFGIRILPSLYLLSPEQKIAATDADFRSAGALISDQALTQFVDGVITGKSAN